MQRSAGLWGIAGGGHARRYGSVPAAQSAPLYGSSAACHRQPAQARPPLLQHAPLPSAAPSIIPGRSSSWIFASL